MKSYELDTNAPILEEGTTVTDTATLSPAADKTDDVTTDVTAPEEGSNSILGAAEDVANTQATRTTIGKKVKERRRSASQRRRNCWLRPATSLPRSTRWCVPARCPASPSFVSLLSGMRNR
jgi:hypothetical protein